MIMDARTHLANLAIIYNGDWQKIYEAIERKEDYSKGVDLTGTMKYIVLLDEEYPARLRTSYMPPLVLFYEGNLNLLKDDKAISVIVSRDKSHNIHDLTDYFLKNSERTLVLGGSNAEDHIIDVAKNIILVLPCGIGCKNNPTLLDMVNKVLAKGGLVLSEYPTNTEQTQSTCVARNRIIEGLSKKTLVLEIKKMSGGVMRVNMALEMNKEILVLPKLAGDEEYFNNELILEGAKACVCREQLDD